MTFLPKARSTEIVVQELGNELLIYNLETHQAYQLNETSMIVYQACNGSETFDNLRKKYKFTDDLIHLTLDGLKRQNLIDSYESPFAGINRREIIRRVGLATMIALPVIATLSAPSAASAASPFARGSRTLEQSCNVSSDCAPSAPNCSSQKRCCVGSGSLNTGTAVNGCSVRATCTSQFFTCQANANSFCCSGAATVVCNDAARICNCACS